MSDSTVSILIVDDRPEKLLSLEAVLEDLHEKVVCVSSGREALRLLLNQEFAVILLDVNMPDMDGFETASMIRQRRSSSHVPIIFLTAMADEMHVARGYSLGAVDYILTPVVPEVLRSKVAVFVDLFRKNQQVHLQAERLRQRATQLHRLTSASLNINSAPSVQRIVQIATQTAKEMIGVDQAITIAVPGDESDHRASHAIYSDEFSAWRDRTPTLHDHGIDELVCATNKPMRMSDSELSAHAPAVPGDSQNSPPPRGLLAAPLCARDGANMGLIRLSNKIGGEFTDDDQAILVQLAQMAALAIENTIYAEEREANRLKDEFLSTLSHELRTPLNAIAGWVHLMKLSPDQEDISHALTVIDRNVRAQTKLIEDLLDLSRITTGKLRVQTRPADLRQIVEGAIDAIRPVVDERRIQVVSELNVPEAIVSGDVDRLQQVCGNLLNNAIKFTGSGGVITVRLAATDGHVELKIIDTGEGIDSDFLPCVFDRFRQADSTSSRRHGGLGIGLAIVQHIVALHRGTVRAESAGRGHGATFTVTLPLAAARGDGKPLIEQTSEQSQKLPSLREMQVLVVDDEPDARDIIAELLRRQGAQVGVAGSAKEVMSLLQTQKWDVLVTDLAMPDQDGFTLLQEIRKLPANRGGKIAAIALTAYARSEDRAQTQQSGFQSHLSKPVDPAQLIQAIARCARRPQTSEKDVNRDVPSPISVPASE